MEAERVTEVRVSAYTVPTDFPESDGTLEWNATTVVLVEIWSGTTRGLGFTYGDLSTAGIVDHVLSPLVLGHDPMAISSAWLKQLRRVRNFTRPGIASLAIAAVDSALWDLKARLLDMPLVSLLGRVRDTIPVYGSGGFTSYSTEQVQAQFREWAAIGIKKMKMKVGRDPDQDVSRVKAAREAIGPDPELFVDANGAYTRKQALEFAERFAAFRVRWFEEPVSSDDLAWIHFPFRIPNGLELTERL